MILYLQKIICCHYSSVICCVIIQGWRPLHYAALYNSVNCAATLIRRYKANLCITDKVSLYYSCTITDIKWLAKNITWLIVKLYVCRAQQWQTLLSTLSFHFQILTINKHGYKRNLREMGTGREGKNDLCTDLFTKMFKTF